MFRKVAFTMYPVKDVGRARDFYENTLGLALGSAGGHGDMHWIEYDLPGGGCLAITNAGNGEPGIGGGTVALEVNDLDALIDDLKTKSVRFESDVIHGPNCRMAVCLDSEGNSILLHQLNPE
jgi:predicted enzyme related to lactoylglutathione lyase